MKPPAFLAAMLLFAGGCQSQPAGAELQNIISVTIEGPGLTHDRLNREPILIKDEESMSTFLTAIQKASFTDGPVNTRGEDFTLLFEKKDGSKTLYAMWLDEENSKGMIEQGDERFILTEEDVKKAEAALEKASLLKN